MAARSVWGIDIGQAGLRAIRLANTQDGNVEVVSWDIIDYPAIISQPDIDPEKADGYVQEALVRFVSRQDITNSDIALGMAGQRTFAKFTKLPPVEPSKIDGLVQYEAAQQIPFPMADVVWDYQVLSGEDSPEVEIGIFAIRREVIDRQLTFCKGVNLAPSVIQTNPMAVYNAAKFDGMLADDGLTVLIDIGSENTDLLVAGPESLWQRNIAIGGNAFTNAMVSSFKQSFSKAENLKRTAEGSKYQRQIFQAMKPVFMDLVSEISKSVGYYSSTHSDAQVSRYVLVGNAFKFPGLQQFLQQQLNGEVIRADHFTRAVGPATQDPRFQQNTLALLVPYGLALQGLGHSGIETNLLPSERASELRWKKKVPWFIASAACLAAAAGVAWTAYAIHAGSYQANSTLRAQTAGIVTAAQNERTRFDSVKNAGAEDITRINTILALQEPRQKVLVPLIYDVILRSLPKNEALRAENTSAFVNALRKQPRASREVMFLEGLRINYVPDFNELQDETGGRGRFGGRFESPGYNSGGGFGEEGEVQKPPAKPGFMVSMVIRTPRAPENEGYNFVLGTFVSNVIQNAQPQGKAETWPLDIETRTEGQYQPIKWYRSVRGQQGMPEGGGRDFGLGSFGGGREVGPDGELAGTPDPIFPGERIDNDTLMYISFRFYIRTQEPKTGEGENAGQTAGAF